jgi:hypothetical protein
VPHGVPVEATIAALLPHLTPGDVVDHSCSGFDHFGFSR